MKTLSAEDRVVVERLLTEVAGRLDGAIDFWTVVCIGRIPPDPRAFVLRQCDILKSLVVSVSALLTRAVADEEAVSRLLGGLASACEKLERAFLVLEGYREVPLEELRSATVALAEAISECRTVIAELSQTLELTITYWRDRGTAREQYNQQILTNLFDLCCQEREARQAATSSLGTR